MVILGIGGRENSRRRPVKKNVQIHVRSDENRK